jgi:hypothetical protein
VEDVELGPAARHGARIGGTRRTFTPRLHSR